MEQVLGESVELMYSSLSAMQKTRVQSLGWEDPLEKELATPVFSLESPMDRGAWWATVHGVTKSQTGWTTSTHEVPNKEGWVLKKTLQSPMDSKEIKPVHPKGNQPWIFTGRTDAEAEAPILWPPDVKSRLIGKDLDAGNDWRQEEKGMTEDKVVGWHHQLSGHESEHTPGDGDGQGSQACCSSAATATKSHPTLCNPIDGSPPGSPIPGILQARTLKWVAISFSNAWKWKVKMKSLCRVRLFTTSWTAAHQAPPSMGFSRQEYWSGVPLPSSYCSSWGSQKVEHDLATEQQQMCLINSCSLFYILNLLHLRNLSWLWICELFATCGWNSMNDTVLEHTCVSLTLNHPSTKIASLPLPSLLWAPHWLHSPLDWNLIFFSYDAVFSLFLSHLYSAKYIHPIINSLRLDWVLHPL